MNQQQNYKLIIALKSEPQVSQLYAIIKYNDKEKRTDLPQSEGQFFHFSEIQPESQISISIHSNQKLGEFDITIPQNIFEQDETELSDLVKFDIPRSKKTLKVKYYVMVLNKKLFQERKKNNLLKPYSDNQSDYFSNKEHRSQSPSNMKYMQSQQEHEDQHSNKFISKKLLNQKNNSPNMSEILQDHQPLNETYAKYTDRSSKQKKMKELKDENEFLKKKIISLESQLKNPQSNDELKKALQDSNQQREQLHGDINQKAKELKKQSEKYSKMIDELREQKQECDNTNNQLQEKINQLLNQIDDLKLQIQQKNAIIQELRDKNALIDDYSKLCKEQKAKLEAQDKKLKELQCIKGEDEKSKSKQKANKERQLQELINKLRNDFVKEQSKSQSLQSQVDTLQNKLNLVNNQISAHKQLTDLNDRLKQQNDSLRDQMKHLEDIIENLRQQIQKLEDQPNATEDEKLKKYISELEKLLKEKNMEIDDKDAQILKLQTDIQSLKFKLDSIKGGSTDPNIQNRDLLVENSQLLQTVTDLTKQLQYINKQLLEARLSAKDYKRESEEKDAYLNSLKHLILTFQERGVIYIPKTADRIDNALASYLNSHDEMETLKNLFVRESEGVYQFGSKKIYIKVEQDKIKIRSGGGFMNIEDFLQMFSITEMDKMQKSDPLHKIQRNKAIHRKMESMKQVKSIQAESDSPIKKSTKF